MCVVPPHKHLHDITVPAHTSALTLCFSVTQTDKRLFFPPPQDNSCAVKWDRRRKSIYPRRAALMTWLPSCSGSPSGPTQDAFVSAGWTRRWRVGVQGQRQADRCHTTHSFFRTQAVLLTCVYWHYPWCCPPSSSRWLGLSPRFTGVMVCETGRGEGVCVWRRETPAEKQGGQKREMLSPPWFFKLPVCLFPEATFLTRGPNRGIY